MKAIFLLHLSGCLALKLLESTYPTTPYKPVPLVSSKSGCAKVETYADENKLCRTASSTLPVPVDTVSACATTLKTLSKTYKDDGETADLTALKLAADRCCQDVDDDTADDQHFLGWASVGLGKPRLDGLGTPNCEGYSIATHGTTKGTVAFYEEVVTHPTAVTAGDYGCAIEAGNGFIVRKKVTAVVPTALTVKAAATNGDDADEMLEAAAAACNPDADEATCVNNKLIEQARLQCSKTGADWWDDLDYAPTQEEVKGKDVVCGGFCTVTTSKVVAFYHAGSCILSADSATSLSDASTTERCYSSLGLSPASADMPKAFNDPKVVNLAGESFEILQTGTFQMVSIAQAQESLVSIAATIDRAGSVCGATYIQNTTVTGKWVRELGPTQIQVRAAAALPKKDALQVSLDDVTWNRHSDVSLKNSSFSTGEFSLNFQQSLSLKFSIDSHRIVEGTKKTRRFANFLNLNVKGLKGLSTTHKITGLLSTDAHGEVAKSPEDCSAETAKFISKITDYNPTGCPLEQCGEKPSPR